MPNISLEKCVIVDVGSELLTNNWNSWKGMRNELFKLPKHQHLPNEDPYSCINHKCGQKWQP